MPRAVRLVIRQVLAVLTLPLAASGQSSTWLTYGGGAGSDFAYAVVPTQDGGYVLGGYSTSASAGGADGFLWKLSSAGAVLWQYRFDEGEWETIYSVFEAANGDLVVTGRAGSSTTSHLWTARLTANGNIRWQDRRFAGDLALGLRVFERGDGTLWVACSTAAFGRSGQLLVYSPTGQVLDELTIGGGGDFYLSDMAPTSDGGALVAGYSVSGATSDVRFIRVDAALDLVWHRVWGGPHIDECHTIQPRVGGGFFAAGRTDSPGIGADALLMRLDDSGGLVWQRTYGGTEFDRVRGVVPTPDGGCLAFGDTSSFDLGTLEGWFLRIDDAGSILWERAVPEPMLKAFSAAATPGGFVVAGLFRLGSDPEIFAAHMDGNGWFGNCGLAVETPASVGAPGFPLLTTTGGAFPIQSSPIATAITRSTTSFLPIHFCTSEPGAPLCSGDGSGSPCPCGNEASPGLGCENSTEVGARLVGLGSASVGAADLVLRVHGAVPAQNGLFFQGLQLIGGGAGVSFGDGLRCVGGSIVRLQVLAADGEGRIETTISIASEGGVVPGDLRHYQLWYRDPLASPCGAGFNLSNAYSLDWVP